MEHQPGYWELRFADATANLYLLLAAAITAGVSGLSRNLPLKQKDVTSTLTVNLTDTQRQEHGITDLMPDSLGLALDALEGWIGKGKGDGEGLRNGEGVKGKVRLDEEFLRKYVETKRAEMKSFGDMEGKPRRDGV